MSWYSTRRGRPVGVSDQGFGGAGLNLDISALTGETEMFTIFDDFNDIIANEAGNGIANWETVGWVLDDSGAPLGDGIAMNDEGVAGPGFTSCIYVNPGTADDTGLFLGRAVPAATNFANFVTIPVATTVNAAALDNKTLVFACRIGLVSSAANFTGKVYVGWQQDGQTNVMTEADGSLITGAPRRLLGFHINGDPAIGAANISGVAQRLGGTAYAEGTNFTSMAGTTWNVGWGANTLRVYDLALRANVVDWDDDNNNGTVTFFWRELSPVAGTPGDDVFAQPGEGYVPWRQHGTVLTNQFPSLGLMRPCIEVLNGGGNRCDAYLDWWVFGQSRATRGASVVDA